MGPMLYAIATHEIARRAVEMEGVVWGGGWYLDDGILVGRSTHSLLDLFKGGFLN